MSGGKTSGIPPTLVLTQRRPHEAASRIAIQNASVKDVFKNIWPLHSTSLTLLCGILPSSSILSAKLYLSFSSSRIARFGPSPPIMKWTSGYFLMISGIISTSRSIPFLKWSLDITTILILLAGFLKDGSGVNLVVSTAFGIT